MTNEPFLLFPAGKDNLWGGERLKTEYNKQIDMKPLAETWECSTHPDGPSIVMTGPYRGKTLSQVIALEPEIMGTKFSEEKEFPILVKFIDAMKDLSIQVHPDDEYARKYEHQNGKTEMWYILDAKEGASIIYGFEHETDEKVFRRSLENGTILNNVHRENVKKGDTFLIPAGTIHAICSGVLLAEIQESSNVTYRVYDYDRVDKNNKKRELHVDKAVDVLDFSKLELSKKISRITKYRKGYSEELLCRCKFFETKKYNVFDKLKLDITKSSFHVLLCIEGGGCMKDESGKEVLTFSKGDCMFLPACDRSYTVKGNVSLLEVRC